MKPYGVAMKSKQHDDADVTRAFEYAGPVYGDFYLKLPARGLLDEWEALMGGGDEDGEAALLCRE